MFHRFVDASATSMSMPILQEALLTHDMKAHVGSARHAVMKSTREGSSCAKSARDTLRQSKATKEL